MIIFLLFFCNWYSLHARLNSHDKAQSYKKKKQKKMKRIQESMYTQPFYCLCLQIVGQEKYHLLIDLSTYHYLFFLSLFLWLSFSFFFFFLGGEGGGGVVSGYFHESAQILNMIYKSIRPKVFYKERVLKIFANFTGKYLC